MTAFIRTVFAACVLLGISAPFAAGQDQDVEGSKALTTKCAVPAGRLWAYGSGPYVPVASNDSEDGRARNRRVELVKQ
jgi:hypothetical protein